MFGVHWLAVEEGCEVMVMQEEMLAGAGCLDSGEGELF